MLGQLRFRAGGSVSVEAVGHGGGGLLGDPDVVEVPLDVGKAGGDLVDLGSQLSCLIGEFAFLLREP
ncbi:hypothetical protein AB0D12_38685 [Streptomyces sp. NPDC048479]|uniref:hypothetical protein n=1 Tax=Streptomyces sp. NPDC048479 TaxID=3154725 RepID=UPI00344485BE